MLPLLPYQQEIYKRVIAKPHCALFLEMGFGKTAIMLNVISHLRSKQVRPLVIAPPHVASLVWSNENSIFTPWLRMLVIPSACPPSKRTKLMNDATTNPPDVLVLTSTLVKWFFDNNYHQNYQALIIDESTKFKCPRGVGFKILQRNLPQFTHRYIMTGTPIPNGYEDLWAQMYLVDAGKRLGANITAYRMKYFTKHTYNMYQYFLLPNADKQIQEAIQDITISRSLTKTDITLPPEVSEIRYTNMSHSLLRDYKQLRKQFIIEVKKSPLQTSSSHDGSLHIVAKTQATLVSKLLQYCSGAVYLETGDYVTLHTLKLELFQEVLANFPSKILLAYHYRHEAERLQQAFPNDVIHYDGNPSTIALWALGSTPRVLLAHPASISHGLNLQHACNVIVWFGFTWNLEHYQQFNKRLHRRGQQDTVYILHLAVGSIEYNLMDRLKSKDLTQQDLLRYMEQVSLESTSQETFVC